MRHCTSVVPGVLKGRLGRAADDHDRKRLPNKFIPSLSGQGAIAVPNEDLLSTGQYIPQNHTFKPYPLTNFAAAPTSLNGVKKK